MGLLSVIIPCYNASAFIETCLDSLQSQGVDDIEAILIDDCSTDNTIETINRIKGKYSFSVRLIKNEINSGPAYARKIGAMNASNLYLAFCDVDDCFSEHFVEEVSKRLTIHNPDMVIFGYNMVLPNGIIRPHRYVQADVMDASKEKLFLTGINSLCSLVIKKELFLSVEHPDLRNGEDMAVIPLFLANADTVHIISKPLYNYVSRTDSISNTSNMKVVKSLLASFDHVRQNMPMCYKVFEEYIGISRVLYGTILNLMKVKYDRKEAITIKRDFTTNYPHWKKNKYIKTLPRTRRIFVWFIGNNLTLVPWLMTKMHSRMIR